MSSIFLRHGRVLIASFGHQTESTPALHRPVLAYLSLRRRRNFLYGDRQAVSSSKLLHQLNQLEQVLEAKETSASGHRHGWIFRHHRVQAAGMDLNFAAASWK
jgi:hypothetical protein